MVSNTISNIGFRVTSSIKHGKGHLSRCLKLVESLNYQVTFFIDPNSHIINSHINIIEEKLNSSATLAISALKQKKINVLVFDNYNISFEEIEDANRYGICVVIDDLLLPWKNSVVIAPNLGAHKKNYIGNKNVFAGPKYALVDKNYKKAFNDNINNPKINKIKNSILIQVGAIDSKNNIKKILNIINEINPKIKILTVVLSNEAPHREEIKNILDNFNNSKLLEVNKASDMIKLYMAHNIIIGAAGVSLLERLSMGIYSLVFSVNQNQELNSLFIQKHNLGLYGGRIDELSSKDINNIIMKFIMDNKTQFLNHNLTHKLIDDKGSDRVAKILNEL